MNDWSPSEESVIARRLMRSEESGVLSTLSQELPGYPFGSVTPYAMTHEGEIAIYVSGIAQHTANIDGDARVCLTVLERGAGNQQALGRASVLGDALVVPEDARERVAARYFSLFPSAREYAGTHAFEFYWIKPRRVRYIGGFGRIFWIEESEWHMPTPEWGPGEAGIIAHMNNDHGEFVTRVAHRLGVEGTQEVQMVACDAEGFHLRSGDLLAYAAFASPALTQEALRAAVMALA